MSFLATDLFRQVWSDLGKIPPLHRFSATGGSATTIVNSLWGAREDAPEDNYCLDWTAIVVKDAGGAGAAPEGKIARISAYSSSDYTYTIDTVATPIASGDEIWIANRDISIFDMYALANRALLDFGDVLNVDSSLSIVASQTKYTLPTGTKRDHPIQLSYADSDDDDRLPVANWKITADGYLFIPEEYTTGRKIYLTYVGPHATLTAYNTAISEDIHPQKAIAATEAYVMQWLNGTQSGGNQYTVQRENKALQDFTSAKMEHPQKTGRQTKWFTGRANDTQGY